MKTAYIILILLFFQSCISIKTIKHVSENGDKSKQYIIRTNFIQQKSYGYYTLKNKDHLRLSKTRNMQISCRCIPKPGKTISKKYENGILTSKNKILIDNQTFLKNEKQKTYIIFRNHKILKEKSNRNFVGNIATKHIKYYDENGKFIKNEITIDSLANNKLINF